MPQNGFHGLVGLAVAKQVARRVPEDRVTPMATGLVLGAMLPDIDIYPSAIAFLAGHKELTYEIHRTATHSLAAVLLVAAIALVARGKPRLAWWLGGFALGMVTHLALDLFLWFEQLDLFWPFSHLPPGHPWMGIPNLWKNVNLPPLLGNPDGCRNLRDAFEFAAVGLYLAALGKVAPLKPERPALRISIVVCWVLFAVALVGVAKWPNKRQTILVMAPSLLYFLPYTWMQTVKRGEGIGAWCRAGRQGNV